MNRLALTTLCLATFATMTACDPAFVRAIDVESPRSASIAPFPLSDIDALAASLEFVRTEPRAGHVETLESQGYELVAYYELSRPESSNIEWLTISVVPGGRHYRLNLFAFVALGEPGGLREFREALTNLLCEKGYVLDGAEGCDG